MAPRRPLLPLVLVLVLAGCAADDDTAPATAEEPETIATEDEADPVDADEPELDADEADAVEPDETDPAEEPPAEPVDLDTLDACSLLSEDEAASLLGVPAADVTGAADEEFPFPRCVWSTADEPNAVTLRFLEETAPELDEATVLVPDGCDVEEYTDLGRDGRVTRCTDPDVRLFTILEGDLSITFGAVTSDEAAAVGLLGDIVERVQR